MIILLIYYKGKYICEVVKIDPFNYGIVVVVDQSTRDQGRQHLLIDPVISLSRTRCTIRNFWSFYDFPGMVVTMTVVYKFIVESSIFQVCMFKSGVLSEVSTENYRQ